MSETFRLHKQMNDYHAKLSKNKNSFFILENQLLGFDNLQKIGRDLNNLNNANFGIWTWLHEGIPIEDLAHPNYIVNTNVLVNNNLINEKLVEEINKRDCSIFIPSRVERELICAEQYKDCIIEKYPNQMVNTFNFYEGIVNSPILIVSKETIFLPNNFTFISKDES